MVEFCYPAIVITGIDILMLNPLTCYSTRSRCNAYDVNMIISLSYPSVGLRTIRSKGMPRGLAH